MFFLESAVLKYQTKLTFDPGGSRARGRLQWTKTAISELISEAVRNNGTGQAQSAESIKLCDLGIQKHLC